MLSKTSDFARFFGASAVFYFHVGLGTGFRYSRWGEYAVALFILLAGVAYVNFSSAKPTDFPSYKRYVGTRLKAIFPLFVSINCLIFIASFLHSSALGRPFTFTELFLSSTGLSQYFGCRYLSTPMWFVPFILQAYLAFPIVDEILNRISGALVMFLAFSISIILIWLVFVFWPAQAMGICRNWSVVFRLPEVCVGVILGRCLFSRCSIASGVAALVTFAGLSLVQASLFKECPSQSYVLSLPWNGIIVTLVIIAASTLAAASCGRLLGQQTLRFIGTASFPFFLAHGIGILFILGRFGDSTPAWVIYFVGSWLGALSFTWIFRYAARAIRPQP